MARILVVEDDPDLNRLICYSLRNRGYEVVSAANGAEALEKTEKSKFNMILTDIMMPKMDGFALADAIRSVDEIIPIIFMTAKEDKPSKLLGYQIGVDDYVVKPFSPKELMLRIEAVMKRVRRAPKELQKKENIVISLDEGGLRADVTARLVFIDGERVDMSPKEYDLFFYMLENRNIALSREKLISDVWGYDFFGDVRTLDTHIKLLRKSLGRYANLIVTLRGVGYRFEG